MLTWFSLVNFWTREEQQHQRRRPQKHVAPGQPRCHHSEKLMFPTKADPIAKTTSVNVAAEDAHSRLRQSDYKHEVPDEKLSATLALSLELAKQNYLPQQRSLLHTEAALSKSSSRESLTWLTSNKQQPSKALSMKSGRSTVTHHRWVYPSKAMAEALSTSVSASGSILTSDLSDDDIDLVSDRRLHTTENFTLHKNDSVSSVIGRSAAVSKLLKQVETSSCSGDMVTKSEDLFPRNVGTSLVYTQSEMMTHIDTQASAVTHLEIEERSSSPASSGGNPVLPTFHTVFQTMRQLEFPNQHNKTQSTPQSFLETARNIFTNAFRQAEEYPQELKRQMFIKFSNFIPDMKERRVEKKIVIIGVHGWFPSKVDLSAHSGCMLLEF